MLTSNPLSSPALKPVVLLQHHMQVPSWLVRCVLNLANVILVFIEFFIVDMILATSFETCCISLFVCKSSRRIFENIFFARYPT